MAKSDDRAERVFGHSGIGYGSIVTGFLTEKEKPAYRSLSKIFKTAVDHQINADNFLEIIYVYKNYGNIYKTGNFFVTDELDKKTQEEFIDYTIKELLSSGLDKINGHYIPYGLQIVASKTPINVEETPKTSMLELKNGEIVEISRGIEFLGEYVKKDGVFKHLKFKNSQYKSVQKRRKSKSKNKRSPKRRQRH